MINTFMEQLAKELELPPEVAQDVGGKYALPMDDESIINLSDVPPGFSITANVCQVPERDLETYYQHVLHGNLLGQGTSDAILGLSEDGKNLTLSMDIDYSVSYIEFKETVEEFLNTLDFWREETRAIKAGKKIQ